MAAETNTILTEDIARVRAIDFNMQFTGSLVGSVITESVFSWPGVGRLVIDAIKSQDVETVTGSIIMTSMITSLILLVVDLLYAFVDPRIKAQYSK